MSRIDDNRNIQFYICYWSGAGYSTPRILLKSAQKHFFKHDEPAVYLDSFFYFYDGKDYYEFFTKQKLIKEVSYFVVSNSNFRICYINRDGSLCQGVSAIEFQKHIDFYITQYGLDTLKQLMQDLFAKEKKDWEKEELNRRKQVEAEKKNHLWVDDYIKQ